MPEFPDTRDSLIDQVRDPSNQLAWSEFELLYRPVVFRIARAKGLQHCDALDVVQQVMMSVASAIGSYEKRGDGVRFRNWLGRITRNAILKALSRGPKDRAAGGPEILDVLTHAPSPDPATDALISIEYRRGLFRRAAAAARQAVQEHTWLAFEMTVLQERPIEYAAKRLGVSAGSVYAARSRVMRRVRDKVRELSEEDSPDEIF